jgi:hypothetical protein
MTGTFSDGTFSDGSYCDGSFCDGSFSDGSLCRIMIAVYIRRLQFYTYFGISEGIRWRMIDIGKKISVFFMHSA